MDCDDESDEDQCSLVKMDSDKYRKVHMPDNPNENGRLKVEVGFDVLDISEINEPEVGKESTRFK